MLKIECRCQIKSLFKDSPLLSFVGVHFDSRQQFLILPSKAIEQLDLLSATPRRIELEGDIKLMNCYSAVQLSINDRHCSIDVLEIPGIEIPILGMIPLRLMDFVVDFEQRSIVGNPEHDGEEIHDLLLDIA